MNVIEVQRALDLLSPREREVLRMMADGMAYKDIGARLGLSIKTISWYRQNITNKLMKRGIKNANSIAMLARFAVKAGLVSCLTLCAWAQTQVSLSFSWDNPGAQYTNLVYKLYRTTNASLPVASWTPQVLTNVVQLPNNRLGSTNSFPYDNWFFAVTWSNTMWKQESFFSNVAAPDRLPPTNQLFNLGLFPTP